MHYYGITERARARGREGEREGERGRAREREGERERDCTSVAEKENPPEHSRCGRPVRMRTNSSCMAMMLI